MTQTQSALQVSAPPPRGRRWLRWVKRILLGGIALLLVALAGGAIYQWIGYRNDARRFPQQGRFADAGGFRLNIDCSGTPQSGTPAVILESGAGVPAVGWKFVQPEIAKFAYVCSYDRGGYAWSDPPLDSNRSSAQIVKELHSLLQNAGVKPPYILVGHSLGGFNIRVYNGEYPNEVAGAVFVDSSHPDQLQRMSPGLRELFKNSANSLRQQVKFLPFLIDFGVLRFTQHRQRAQEHLPLDFVDEVNYLQQSVPFTKALLGEMDAFEQSADQVRKAGDFGSKPVVVLTAGKETDIPGLPKKDSDDFHQLWVTDLQPQLARLSTDGKQIVVPNSDHMIPFEAPQTIVDAVHEVFASATRPRETR